MENYNLKKKFFFDFFFLPHFNLIRVHMRNLIKKNFFIIQKTTLSTKSLIRLLFYTKPAKNISFFLTIFFLVFKRFYKP